MATPPKSKSLGSNMGLDDPKACDFLSSHVLELLCGTLEVSYWGDEGKIIVLGFL